ncbi:alpha-(1-_3)-arabinofuranosyltransferase domain-containing protein [Streptomyces rimosus]|uniref:alpha-(1->3)-arabinofuranosyltransferase domain-containing protein n=1 Tax=Streptomyces rimosus TaxID=1927 RepID=UPI0020B77E89|nr:alpha-(1->3)-arabinofuranosyltransferase family protein [Streptomyces rimosus]UTH97460.1 Alpha-(1->3)-arabinofuranosyltransferase [Streptomyces rimosus subsp. rimosus]UTJ15558.1 Alpha-(1->3)-arabinofuranosyltransferase [Streptomyces rimosus subsp. rimosus]
MTQTLVSSSPGSPDAGGTPAAAPGAPPPGPPRSRRWLLAFWALAFVLFLVPSFGKMTFETKLGVTTDPWKFLSDLGQLWHDRAGFGGITDQYVGYAFPSLPYYALADLVHLPVWIAERLWMSLIVTTAFWGALRLAERLRVGSPPSRLLAAAAYALWPTFTMLIGSTSAAALPGALLPWVLLPLTSHRTPARLAATRSALLIPFMGGVNAASTLASLLPVLLYVLSRTGPRHRSLLVWWIPGVVLATAWWAVPLLLLGVYGENFMPYIEQATTTTGTMSATELLRGAGNWVGYLNFGEPWLPAGWTLVAGAGAVLGTALAAALGLAGLARRDVPERRWLLLTVLVVAGICLTGYAGSLGGPFHGLWQDWLDGWLRPFRNIYKFQPGLALALAYGLAHILGVAAERRGTRRVPGRQYVPLLVALLTLPALALPYLNGTVLQPGAFKKLPSAWERTADWLKANTPDNRALVVPATAHGIYTWGSPIDHPLDVLAASRWAQRDFVPFGTPGVRRALDAVEQALMSGSEVPGLRDFLGRAGLYDVVVRNDLDPDQIGYVPTQTVKRTLEASGYRKVAAFGAPTTDGKIAPGTPVQIQGLYPRQRSVEIYEPVGTPRPGPVTALPVADTAQVSGGPEALLPLSADPTLRHRPAVLTGDNHPGVGTPPLQLTGDGLRRADTRFGLVNSNTSYTYTPGERNHPDSLQDPGREPRQILPTEGIAHQTTGVLRGAASVTASSSGNWLFHLPQYDPVHAFDGDPKTGWAEGSAGNPVGQWLRIGFTRPTYIPSTISLTPLPGDGMRAAPTSVLVQTDRGSVATPLLTNGQKQRIWAPGGTAKWLKITITASQTPRAGLSGAGFSEVSIPGVQVTRLLQLPADAEKSTSPAATYSLHRGSDPGGLSPVSAEVGLHRQFRTGTGGSYQVSGRAVAVPGPELDQLLDRVTPGKKNRITATADSTAFGSGPQLSPRNLVDGDLTTAWIAGDKATLHLRWPGKRSIDRIVLAAAGGVSTRPEEILINSPDGAATTGVDENGWARFDPITTDQLDITISKVKDLTVHNPVVGEALQLPVGLSEVYIPALDDLRTPPPSAGERFSLACGQGPPLAVDGTLHATKASGSVRDLTERRPVKVELCAGEARDGRLDLPSGQHRVEAGDQGPLALTDVTLSRGSAPAPATERRTVTARDWAGDRRTVQVSAGGAAYLQTYENANAGWRATLNGRELSPVRLDGWQQGFLIPAGESGMVRLTYAPSTTYDLGLFGGALGIALLIGSALVRRTRRTPPEPQAPPAPSWVLGVVALTVVVALASGPYAVIVPLLALVARFRHGLLVPLALLAMLGAGITAALGAGESPADGDGPFSAVAQGLALLGLVAAVVTVPAGKVRRGVRAGAGAEPEGGPAVAAAPVGAGAGASAGGESLVAEPDAGGREGEAASREGESEAREREAGTRKRRTLPPLPRRRRRTGGSDGESPDVAPSDAAPPDTASPDAAPPAPSERPAPSDPPASSDPTAPSNRPGEEPTR